LLTHVSNNAAQRGRQIVRQLRQPAREDHRVGLCQNLGNANANGFVAVVFGVTVGKMVLNPAGKTIEHPFERTEILPSPFKRHCMPELVKNGMQRVRTDIYGRQNQAVGSGVISRNGTTIGSVLPPDLRPLLLT